MLATIACEIAKDIEDIDGDSAMGLDTLPIRIGQRRAGYSGYAATDSYGSVSSWSEQSRIVIESPDKEGIEKGQQAILYFLAIFGLYSLLNKFGLFSLFKKYLRGKYSNIDTNNLLDSTITRGSFTGLILSGVFSTYLEYDINITNVVFVTVSCIFIFIVKLRNYKKSNL